MLDGLNGRRIANNLIETTVERGFDGWLINVEVELMKEGEGEEKGKERAFKLLSWLDYLKREMKRRVPHGEIMW